jgi:hypothetical protein
MSLPFKTLAERREALVARAQTQRTELEAAVSAVRQRLSLLDGAFAVAAKLRRQPVLTGVVAAGVAALLVSPRRGMKWISYAATAYSLARRLSALVSRSQR